MKKILTIWACMAAGVVMAQTMPIEISNAADLAKIGKEEDYPLTGSYVLTEDIDLTNVTWTPIGTTDENHSFQGIFDGNGKKISHITVTIYNASSAGTYVGLFGRIGESGVVKDLTIESGDYRLLRPNDDVDDYSGNIGSIVGVNHGQIINCTSKAEVYCGDDNTDGGGIAGENGGVIRNCTFTGKIETSEAYGDVRIGGVVGDNETNGVIVECKVVNATVSNAVGSNSVSGKIYGQNNAKVSDCYSVEGLANDATVKFEGRTFYKDGDWNTICFPFGVSSTSDFLKEAYLMELDVTTTTSDVYNTRVAKAAEKDEYYTLYLAFKDVTGLNITAGVPYLIRWLRPEGSSDESNDFVNPTINQVIVPDGTVSAGSVTSNDGRVTFQGILSAKDIAADGDNSILFLSGSNTLYYPNAAMTIGANRAYFQLNNGFKFADPVNPASIRAFSLSYGEMPVDATDIDSVNDSSSTFGASWYTLQGIPLDGQPIEKGVYIFNGKKIMIK